MKKKKAKVQGEDSIPYCPSLFSRNAGYWPRSLLHVDDLDFILIHKMTRKKELGHYPAILPSGQ